MKRKSLLFLALTLALATVMNLFAGIVVFAEDTDPASDTIEAVVFTQGRGTADDPYQITEAGHLVYLSKTSNLWSKCFKLMNDIDLSVNSKKTEWTPIGNSDTKFTGTFDGNDYTISGFKITEFYGYMGLFGYAENATIEYLTVDTAEVIITTTGKLIYAGVLVGRCGASTVAGCRVGDDSKIKVTVDTQKELGVGGMIGRINSSSTVSYCENRAVVEVGSFTWMDSVATQRFGGLIGYVHSSKVSYCINYGAVSDSPSDYRASSKAQFGALIGGTYSLNVSNCINYGALEYDNSANEGALPTSYRMMIGNTATTCKALYCIGASDTDLSHVVKNATSTSDITVNNAVELNNLPEVQAILAEVAEHITGVSTDFVGYQTTAINSNGRFDMRLIATITGDYTKCQNVGFKVTVNTLGEQIATTTALYESITATADGAESETEVHTAKSLGGDYIFVLVCKGLPANTALNFTVTTFYTTADGEIVSETETFTATVPNDTVAVS